MRLDAARSPRRCLISHRHQRRLTGCRGRNAGWSEKEFGNTRATRRRRKRNRADSMQTSTGVLLLFSLPAICQEVPGQPPAGQPTLRQRTELPGNARTPDQPQANAGGLWIVPAGTKIPIQLRQAVSTKNVQPGDPIYAQTTFPIVVDGVIMISAGTYAKGVLDASKRAGRIKGRAELQFHLTSFI